MLRYAPWVVLALLLGAQTRVVAEVPSHWRWADGYPRPSPKTMLGGLPRSTTDRADQQSGPQLHVMYVIPSDGVDEQHDTNGRIGTSVVAFNDWLASQSGRKLRLDTYEGLPDVTFHRLSRTDAQIRAYGAYVRNELEYELRAAGKIDDAKLYAVYYGGSSNYSCGGGAYPPALVGNVGAMYLKGEPPGFPACATNELGTGIETPGYFEFGMLHELVHTLGFVAGCAPHHHLAGHVSDDANDLMWSGNAPWVLPPRLDIGGDDYYGHAIGGCLDLEDSAFLTPAEELSRLAGISTRMRVLTGDDVLIGGFIIDGSASKTVVINARGPSLASQGVSGVMANPVLTLVPASGPPITNDDWQSAPNAATIQSLGYAPPHAMESSILVTLGPGAYTAIVSGVGGGTGVGIVEVFEVDEPDSPLIGISTRGRVETGDNVLIAGFIIGGATPRMVAIRARGPSLASQGVSGVLMNPTLTLVPASGPPITNDDWFSGTNSAQLQYRGYAPSDSRESAIFMLLQPGAYTAIVSGVGGSSGVAIVEVYEVP